MEDFVSFEIAKKLKEKGFKEECFAYYHTDGELIYNTDHYRGGIYKDCLRSYNSLPPNPIGVQQVDAPTISQVLKWLREEKEISIEVSIHCSLKWICSIYGFSDGIADYSQYNNDGVGDTIYILYETYELAVLSGIQYVIDNLI